MAMTEAELLARVIQVCQTAGYTQAISRDFDRQPAGAIDQRFTATLAPGVTRGGMNFTEEVRATLLLDVARSIDDDYSAAELLVFTDVRTLLNAIARDGAEASGEYCLDDIGRSVTVEAPKGASYLVGRSRIPLNYEATL